MEWWVLELITVGVMIAIVGILGPLIKRFGKSYAADVFRVNPRTGKSYLVLMDFAYYMIFGAYILFSIKWEPDTGWEQQVNAEQLQGSVVRIGGMLLLMGLLHGLNVLTLPVIGRIFTLTDHRQTQFRWKFHGHVFHGMHCDISSILQHCMFQLFHK